VPELHDAERGDIQVLRAVRDAARRHLLAARGPSGSSGGEDGSARGEGLSCDEVRRRARRCQACRCQGCSTDAKGSFAGSDQAAHRRRAPCPAPPPAPPKAAPSKPRARLSAIARDGSTSADFVLVKDETKVGRQVGDAEVKLDKDPFIAPVHAVFKFDGRQLVVQDAGSANGVFLWLKERQLASGDELRIGRQRLRIEWMPEEPEALADQPFWGSPNPGYGARVVQLLEGGGEGDVFPLRPGDNAVGRGTGDVSFPQDGYVSSRHATITVGGGQIAVKDLGSANGTFVRINGQAPVNAGDLLLVGEQILRVDPA
jgi:pSer/pThr/pTyr-binding forkhead associated (FHA) protein